MMEFHDPFAGLFPHTEQNKQGNQMQRKIFHHLNHRVFPEKTWNYIDNIIVEFPIGEVLEQGLQDKKH